MCKLDEIIKNKENIYAIAKKNKVEKIYVFGSCARKEETNDSDIDFLAKFNQDATLMNYSKLQLLLSNLLKAKVDIVDIEVLNLPENSKLAAEANRDMILI